MEELEKENTTKTLGPRMKISIFERLMDTLDQYKYNSAALTNVYDQLTESADGEDISALSVTEVLAIIERQTTKCHLTNQLYKNLVLDIYKRTTTYRKWRKEELYLSDHFVLSSEAVRNDYSF